MDQEPSPNPLHPPTETYGYVFSYVYGYVYGFVYPRPPNLEHRDDDVEALGAAEEHAAHGVAVDRLGKIIAMKMLIMMIMVIIITMMIIMIIIAVLKHSSYVQ